MAEDLKLRAQIDERVIHKIRNNETIKNFHNVEDKITSMEKTQVEMKKDVSYLTKGIDEIKSMFWDIENKFATKEEVNNVREKVEGHSGYFKWVSTSLIWILIWWLWKILWLY